jgi:hypothetical protein
LDFCHACGESIITLPSTSVMPRRPPFIFAAAATLVFACAVIMGLTIYDFVQQYGVPGGADVGERAQRYVKGGREESAINLLEESLKLDPRDARAPAWTKLLDQSLYSRGKKLGLEGKFRDAVTALSRISANFAGREEVDKLISEYSDKGLPAVFGKSEEADLAPSLEKEKRPLTKIEKAVMTAVPGGKEHPGLVPETGGPSASPSRSNGAANP